MSEVRKGTSRNTGNENKRCKIFNKVLNMNWDYVRGKKTKRKIKINKQKGNKQKKKLKKIKTNLYDSLVLYLTKKWLNP
jgi:predicted transcriptional regulator